MTTIKDLNKEIVVAPTLPVTNPAEMAEATERLSLLKTQLKKVEDHEAKVIKPLNDALKAARSEWKPLKDSLTDAINRIRKSMSDYQTKALATSESAKDKIADRMVKGTLKPETAMNKLASIVTPEESVTTESGKTSFVTDYEIVIDDITKVPFEYLKVELKRAEVKKAIKSGKTITGLTVTEIQVPKSYVG